MADFKVGDAVLSMEHPKAIGKVIRINEDGDITVEWTTPASESLPYGHIILEYWPLADHHLLITTDVCN